MRPSYVHARVPTPPGDGTRGTPEPRSAARRVTHRRIARRPGGIPRAGSLRGCDAWPGPRGASPSEAYRPPRSAACAPLLALRTEGLGAVWQGRPRCCRRRLGACAALASPAAGVSAAAPAGTEGAAAGTEGAAAGTEVAAAGTEAAAAGLPSATRRTTSPHGGRAHASIGRAPLIRARPPSQPRDRPPARRPLPRNRPAPAGHPLV